MSSSKAIHKEKKRIILSNLLLTNIGCEIILRGTVAFLMNRFPQYDIEFYFPSYQKDYDEVLLSDLENVSVIPMLEWRKYVRGITRKLGLFDKFWIPRFDSNVLNHVDLFVSVGGDIYTMFGDEIPRDWVCFEEYMSKRGIPSLMFGANMERFEVVSSSDRARLIDHLKRFKGLLVRDKGTQNYLSGYDIRENCQVFPDPIFSLRNETTFELKPTKVIGINFTPILLREFGHSIVNIYSKLIESLIENGYTVHLIPHVTTLDKNKSIDDRHALDILMAAISKEYINEIIRYDGECNFNKIRPELEKIDLFIGARMHGCLNSLTLGKKVIFLAYSKKAFTMVDMLATATPFSSVSNCFDAISADEISFNAVQKFIEHSQTVMGKEIQLKKIKTQEFLETLDAWKSSVSIL